jgi:hypothetical protein
MTKEAKQVLFGIGICLLIGAVNIAMGCDKRCQYQRYLWEQQRQQQEYEAQVNDGFINAARVLLEYEDRQQQRRHEMQMNQNNNMNNTGIRWYQMQNLGGY